MPTPPTVEILDLLAAIPGTQPAGKSTPFEVRQKLDDARKEVDPSNYAENDPLRPAEAVRADWPLIIRLTQKTLKESAKDLLIAARLTEGLTKVHGFAGLRDGLSVLHRLIADCWDRLLPVIEEEDDIEARGSAFFWLDDADRGARFPSTIRSIPLLTIGERSFSWFQWKKMQSAKDDEGHAAFEKAFQATSREACQLLVEDILGAQSELNALIDSLSERMSSHAPGLGGLRLAIGECASLAQLLLEKKGGAPVPVEDGADALASTGSDGTANVAGATNVTMVAPPNKLSDRKAIYSQITAAAAALREMEPHSPIPYLLERAVDLGQCSFPELMKILVRDPTILAAMSRELGIKESESS